MQGLGLWILTCAWAAQDTGVKAQTGACPAGPFREGSERPSSQFSSPCNAKVDLDIANHQTSSYSRSQSHLFRLA